MDKNLLTKEEVFVVLDKFKDMLLSGNEKVIYPFNAGERLSKIYFEFFKNEGRGVIKAFAFDQELSYQIIDYLCNVTRLYLAKNKAAICNEKIRENVIFVLGISLPMISQAIPFNQEIFNQQVDSFLQARD